MHNDSVCIMYLDVVVRVHVFVNLNLMIYLVNLQVAETKEVY